MRVENKSRKWRGHFSCFAYSISGLGGNYAFDHPFRYPPLPGREAAGAAPDQAGGRQWTKPCAA